MAFWDLRTLDSPRWVSQPLWDPQARICLAFDGRLDNRPQLVHSLRCAEMADAVLVLTAYLKWGKELFSRLLGDFAIAVWDDRNESLLLARDPMGLKPLYYCVNGSRVVFASESKALLILPEIPRRPEPVRDQERERLRYKAKEETFFAGVKRVWPGRTLRWNASGFERHASWQPDLNRQMTLPSSESYQEEFRNLLFDAVRVRLPENESTAVMLSGGMDSSSITCVAADIQRRERRRLLLQTYTFQSERYPDRLESTREVNEAAGVPHTAVYIDEINPRAGLEQRVFEVETPLAESEINYYHALFHRIHAGGAKVVLHGGGGDEMMTSRAFLADLFLEGRWLRLLSHLPGLGKIHGPVTPNFLKYALWHLILPRRDTPRFRKRSAREVYEGVLEPIRIIYREEQERQAAHHGLELRMPYLDTRLVEFILAIPGEQRIRDGLPKRLSREALVDLIPLAVRRRPKGLEPATYAEVGLNRAGLSAESWPRLMELWDREVLDAWQRCWFGVRD